MSYFGLTLAGDSLQAFQQAEDVTSNNITNVDTTGASREEAILNEAPPIVGSPGYSTWQGVGTKGEGVYLQSIQRVHADSYDTLFRNASSSQYYYTVQQQQLQSTEAQLGEPNSGINAAYTGFIQAYQTLQADPSQPDQRANVLSQATTLVTTISNAGQSIQTQEANVLTQATTLVTQTNGILDQMAALNGQIRASYAVGDNPNTYKDQRDELIDQLSQLLPTQTQVQTNGSVLVTVNGRALVNDTVSYHLAPPIVGTNSNGTVALKIGFTNDPNPLNPQQAPLGTGQLGGLVDLYNNKLIPYQQQLDSFTNSLAFEVNRVATSGYDQNGIPGVAILQPVVASKAISAGNLKVGISQPSQVVAALANTSAGTIVNPLNAGNLQVDTSQSLVANTTLANSPAAAFAGSLTVTTDGVNRTFNYNLAAGGNASSIDSFLTNFNAAQLGVTATFDTTSQSVVFARDPLNEDLTQRSQTGYTPGPTFAITDSNTPQAAGLAGSLLGVLGAAGLQNSPNAQTASAVAAGATSITVSNPTGFAVGQTIRIDNGNANAENATIATISGDTITFAAGLASAHASNANLYVTSTPATAVTQDNTNAFGAKDNGDAISIVSLLNSSVGVPGLSTRSATAFTVPAGTTQNVTLTESVIPGQLPEFSLINPGQQLTFVNNTGQQINGVVQSVNRNTGTISVSVTNNTAAAQTYPLTAGANYTQIFATQSQTLGQYYANFITNVGLDSQTATTGVATQTSLSTNLNSVRQGIDGINLDEESQNLVKYQTAYQAAARVVTIMDQLLTTVISSTGVVTA